MKPPYPEGLGGGDKTKLSVQWAAAELSRQAGLTFNWDESIKNTDPVCRRWVYPNIRNKPCGEALDEILGPLGLTYEIVKRQVVLKRR